MQQYFDYQEYNRKIYKHNLTKDANIIGFILLLYSGVMLGVTIVAMLIPAIFGGLNGSINEDSLAVLDDDTFVMILSGLASIVSFFGVSIIYSIATKKKFGYMFPMEKNGFKMTYHLCTLGLGVCMIANYVSNMLIALFDLFNTDALVETNFNCETPLDILLFYVTIAVLPALVEEFAFRGVILNILRKYSDGLAILVSGVLFGLMHGNFTQIPFALVVGLIFGYIAVKTNSLLPGIIIHFLNNALSVTFSLLTTNTNLSDSAIIVINSIVMFIIAMLSIISFITLSKNHSGFFKIKDNDKTITFKEKVQTVCISPTIIIFTVFTLMEAVLMLFIGV